MKDLSSDTKNNIKVATLGDSTKVKIGEQSIAIGNALGYGTSVTVGYISAVDREVASEDVNMKLLQTDAAINPGNSGGALVDDEGKVIAKFLVAADLSAVYRNDKEDEVSLIYGDPINMLAAKRAPLVEEDELEGPAIESGELEGDEDAPDLPATAASELSPLVTVAPEEASLKVGERTRIVALLPGCVGYNVTDLRSSNSDIVKVDGDVQLLAVKPGTATITGKLLLEKGEKAFMTQITAYEPKLEAPNLPAHLGIDEALKLEAYVVGEADGVTPEWSVSDEKLAVIEDGKLIGKADGVVTVTAVHGELKSQWPVAVGTAELPAAEDEEENEDDDDGFGLLTIIGGVIIIGGAAFFFLRRKRK